MPEPLSDGGVVTVVLLRNKDGDEGCIDGWMGEKEWAKMIYL